MKTILLLFIFLASGNVFAALNKWVDSAGHVHYSDLPPPPDAKAKKVGRTHEMPASSVEEVSGKQEDEQKSLAERVADLKKSQQDKKAAEEKAAKDKEYAESMKASCNAARQNLKIMQEGTRVMEIGENGERSFVTDERRQQNISKAQEDISKYCK